MDITDANKRVKELGEKVGAKFEREERFQELTRRQSEIEEKLDLTKNQAPSQVEAVSAGDDEQKNSENQTQKHSVPARTRGGHPCMNITAQQTEFLSWKVVPARLDATQAAWFLGFEPHEIPRLVTAGLLKPLGHPARNSTKFFATETLEQFRRDEKWLARASDAIASYWRERNARRTACGRVGKG